MIRPVLIAGFVGSIAALTVAFTFMYGDRRSDLPGPPEFSREKINAELANEAFRRSRNLAVEWLEYADPKTELIPRNLYKDTGYWNPEDAGADNYAFMVLAAALTDRKLFDGRMKDILASERSLTSRLDSLPDAWSFETSSFVRSELSMEKLIFGASEYAKDGLMPITELLGDSPWTARLIEIENDIWVHANIPTPSGPVPSVSAEVSGEQMQVLSRLYWMTGEERYLEYAVRLADYHLLGDGSPIEQETLRLRDHGGEIIGGLSEVYAAVSFADEGKKQQYKLPLYTILDKILKFGRAERGLFYNVINPTTGEIIDAKVADTWGYILDAYYTVYQIDGHKPYRDAVTNALAGLQANYTKVNWEKGSADGDADTIESALNLYNREPLAGVDDWIDAQIRVMWQKQLIPGRWRYKRWIFSPIVEGWHGDGNFIRTSLMYGLWKTQGLRVEPWREDVRIGATYSGGTLRIYVAAEEPWMGKILFDRPRHEIFMRMPLDWARINQFPEWYTVRADADYRVNFADQQDEETLLGSAFLDGIDVSLQYGGYLAFEVTEQ